MLQISRLSMDAPSTSREAPSTFDDDADSKDFTALADAG